MSKNTVPFGKYKGRSLSDLLADQRYARWLTSQEWVKREHDWIYSAAETAAKRDPMCVDIDWLPQAMEREYRIQGIKPGDPIKVSYAKLKAYCPQDTINAITARGYPDFTAISICLDLAEQHGLIAVERTTRGKRIAYRLPPHHPMVAMARSANVIAFPIKS